MNSARPLVLFGNLRLEMSDFECAIYSCFVMVQQERFIGPLMFVSPAPLQVDQNYHTLFLPGEKTRA